MSRKLIFASGLLVCFSANLDRDLQSTISTGKNDIRVRLTEHIREHVSLTPLEILARSMSRYGVPEPIKHEFFGAYTEFLELLNQEKVRDALKNLRAQDSRTDPTFRQIRKISGAFEHALNNIFFENELIAPLTRKYGLF